VVDTHRSQAVEGGEVSEMECQFRYEIVFDVSRSHRERYQTWVSTHCLDWITHRCVSSFEIRYNPTGTAPVVKFVFGFSHYQEWVSFVTSETHKTSTAQLKRIATGFEARFWEQGCLEFGKPDPAADEISPLFACQSSLMGDLS